MKSYGFGYAAAFPDIEKYLCVLLRDPGRYHIDNFLPEELYENRVYVLVQDNGKQEGPRVSADCTVGLTILGTVNDKHFTAVKELASSLIVKVKNDVGSPNSPLLDVTGVYGPIRITNTTRPELLTSLEIRLQGH